MAEVSPLAPLGFPDLPATPGVRLAGAHIGLKKTKGAKDLLLVELAPGSAMAGVLTKSKTSSAPVEWCRSALAAGGRARAIVVNSANANAFTGAAGDRTVEETVSAASSVFGCAASEIYVASTGVIGQPVPQNFIAQRLAELQARLSPAAWRDAAEAIMTTDTYPKAACAKARIGGHEVTIIGIAKGSGMIAPDMATMLSFVFTDAAIPAEALQKILAPAADRSFNSITVDGDTSTSDTLLLAATGQAAHPTVRDHRDPALRDFKRKLGEVLADLARQVVRDGEGATKFVTIRISGAASARAARRIGLAIANSPLVKTAIAGEDANWGRIVMAVGKSGERADRDRLGIAIGGVAITEDGQLRPDYDEAPVAAHMREQDIDIDVDVGVGRGKAVVWTCDLTHGYITINADYRS